METAQAPIKSQVKVKVVSLKPLRQLDKGSVLDFVAANAEGKTVTFSLFSFKDGPNLLEMVKPGAELTLDVETKTNTRGDQAYTNHNVMAINGQPRSGKAGGGKGGGWRGSEDSPEKRASIEAQTAVQATFTAYAALCAALYEAKVPPDIAGQLVVNMAKALAWCARALQTAPPPPGRANEAGATSTGATDQPTQGKGATLPVAPQQTAQGMATTPATAEKAKKRPAAGKDAKVAVASTAPAYKCDPASVTNFNGLVKACYRDFDKMTQKDTLGYLGITSKAEIACGYPECYTTIARNYAAQQAVNQAAH